MGHLTSPPAAGDWSVDKVPHGDLHFAPSATHNTSPAALHRANDLRLLSDLVLGWSSLAIDHRIMLDVEFVLGLALLS